MQELLSRIRIDYPDDLPTLTRLSQQLFAVQATGGAGGGLALVLAVWQAIAGNALAALLAFVLAFALGGLQMFGEHFGAEATERLYQAHVDQELIDLLATAPDGQDPS